MCGEREILACSTKRLLFRTWCMAGQIEQLQLCWEELSCPHTYFLWVTAIRNLWKGQALNSQTSGNICSPEIHMTRQLRPGTGAGLGAFSSCEPKRRGRARKFSKGELDPYWGAVYRWLPYCILWMGRPYLSLATGGWWGANLLSGQHHWSLLVSRLAC